MIKIIDKLNKEIKKLRISQNQLFTFQVQEYMVKQEKKQKKTKLHKHKQHKNNK